MSDRDGKENLNQALNLPRPSSQPMGIHAPFKKPTLSFKPPVINQPARTMQIHTSKAARPSNSTAVAPKSNSSSSQRYRVVFLPFEDYAKKKKIRKWQDGFLEIAMGTSTLWSEEGKRVWQGKARQVGGKGSERKDKAVFASKVACRQGNKSNDNDGSDDDDNEGTLRFELGSVIAEAEERVLGEAEFSAALSGSKFTVLPFSDPRPSEHQLAKGKQPLAPISRNPGPSTSRSLKPLHDPSTPGAVILSSKGAVSVVLDPHIARKLRPHQIEGVQFMHSKAGMILADEMGLGKTLQIIALLWTLLKQGSNGRPDVEKCLVVCPSSLVSNWSKEVRKWLGNERLQALTVTQGNPDNSQIIRDFKTIRGNPSRFGLLILSYESARKYSSEIGPNACDLLICDEAHRLKSGEGKTIEALQSLEAKRKILLTGTPVQNNLEEFNALLEFVSPGLHCGPSSSSSFKKNYSDVISKGRDGCASDKERADADERSLELNKIISDIVLRRTSDILIKHLPPLTQLLVFVQPTRVQIDLYRKHLDESERGLSLIRVLQKISTSPALLKDSADDPKESSGKMKLVAVLLEHIIGSGQKCVLVSTSTATLDLIDRYLCIPMGHDTVRIDGSTNVNARQDIVDGFNLRNQGKVMLLSTRAGGAGLNLIGANNLILIDSDWNPAHDLQAMARIWRDGQIKPCFIYRLLTAGTIEEKVYQRQLKKGDLANATVDLKAGSVGLNNEDLRELFSIQPSDETEANGCDTMALLEKSEGSDAPIRWMSTEGGNSLTHHPVLSMAFRSGLVRAIGEVVKGGERVAINEAQSDEEEAVAEIQEVMVTMNEMKPVEKLPQAIDPVNQPLAMNPTLAGTGSRKRLRKMLEEIENESKVLDELEDL